VLVEALATREPSPAAGLLNHLAERAAAAEARAAGLQEVIDGELAALRAMLATVLNAQERTGTADSGRVPESRRPRRRGLLGMLLGR